LYVIEGDRQLLNQLKHSQFAKSTEFIEPNYFYQVPQGDTLPIAIAAFRVLGSSIPELGNALGGSSALNPLFASVLIPLALIALLLGHPSWKWFAIGSALGVTSCLLVSAVVTPDVWWLGQSTIARIFLIANALMCYGLPWLAMQGEQPV